jgi:hypothetical protein
MAPRPRSRASAFHILRILSAGGPGFQIGGRLKGVVKRMPKLQSIFFLSRQAAKAIAKEDVLQPLREAQARYEEAAYPWDFATGLALQGKVPPRRRRQLSAAQIAEARRQIEKSRECIEQSLIKFEEHAEQFRSSNLPLRFSLFSVAVLLFLLGSLAILWGIVHRSMTGMVGRGGAGSFCILTSIAVASRLYYKDLALRTIPDRVRAALDACMASTDYARVHECFGRALKDLDAGFKRIESLASK